MNDQRLLPDDPKLTAYALGELSGDERAEVEVALRENPALRVIVDEIRETAAYVQSALADEPILASPRFDVATAGIVLDLNGRSASAPSAKDSARRKSKVNGVHRESEAVPGDYHLPNPRSKLLRFPQVYYVVATAAAACFAVLVALRDPVPSTQPVFRKTQREIALVPAEVTKPIDVAAVAVPTAPTVEAPIVAAILPPATSESDPSAASSVASAAGENVAPLAPAFLDRNLSLIGQVTRDQDAASGSAPNPRLPIGFGNAAARDRGTTNVTTAFPSNSKTSVSFEAPPSPISGPVVASAAVPLLVPQVTVASSGGTVPTSASGEVVVLSAFMVTADRAVGFAGSANSLRAPTDKRKVARHDDLPSPPPGAKLVKNAEAYAYVKDNDFLSVRYNPLSTFAADVDTASYANVRRILQHGTPPPRDAVRIEEMVNYFPYRYAAPQDNEPFAASLEVADTPWAAKHRLVRIGLKAREVPEAQRPVANLVFLLDVSGSMNQPNKLPLVQQSLKRLVGKLKPDDRVAIVTYAGNSGLALPSTPAAQARDILNALDSLTPGGSANGATGIQLAYEIAKANFIREGINRVILCTDGDFNVGTTSESELVQLIEEKAASGVFLTTLGFGMGNYKDAMLEKLADKGNGNYGYIDTRREAEKMFVEQISSTLMTVAKDLKIQVEFNPATVASYRLIGYENRLLRKEDFSDDKTDAGEVGAGHTLTVLYEIVPVGGDDKAADIPSIDAYRYARGAVGSRPETSGTRKDPMSSELLTVRVRYKKSDSLFSFPRTLEFPLVNSAATFAKASADFRFAAAVAQFGMILRGSSHRGTATMRDVAVWAAGAAADDPGGYRSEFIELVRKAQTMIE